MADPNYYFNKLKVVEESCRHFYNEQLSCMSLYSEQIPQMMTTYGSCIRSGFESFVEKTCQTSITRLSCPTTETHWHSNNNMDLANHNKFTKVYLSGSIYHGLFDNVNNSQDKHATFSDKKFGKHQQILTEIFYQYVENDSGSISRHYCHNEGKRVNTGEDCKSFCSSCTRQSPYRSHALKDNRENSIDFDNYLDVDNSKPLHKNNCRDRYRDNVRIDEYEGYAKSTFYGCRVSDVDEEGYRKFCRRKTFSGQKREFTFDNMLILSKEKSIQTELCMDMFPVCDIRGNAAVNGSVFVFPYNKCNGSKRYSDAEIESINEAFDSNECVSDADDSCKCERNQETTMASVSFIDKDSLTFQLTFYGQREILSKSERAVIYSATLCRSTESQTRPIHVAIKFASKDTDSQVLQEAWILSHLSDTGFIPRFFGVTTSATFNNTSDGMGIVSEFFGSGLTLFEVMRLNFDILMYPEFWANICLQLVRGLRIIHSKGVIVGDLKLSNIMVDCNLHRHIDHRIRFINFSKASYRKGRTYANPDDYRPESFDDHVAPEVKHGAAATEQSDIYGIGFIMLQMALCGKFPPIIDLGHQCMHPHPACRLSYSDILKRLHCLKLDIAIHRKRRPYT